MRASWVSPLIAMGFVVCWSSGFVGGRLATEADTPVLSLFAWRFLLASLLVALWWRLVGGVRLAQRDVVREMAVGSLTMGGYLLGVILALEMGVSTGVAALITALQPLLAAALAGPWLGERLSARGWAGMGVATLGVLLYVVDDLEHGGGSAPLWAYALPVGAVLAVTFGSLLSVRWATAMPVAATLMVQLLAATGIFTLAAMIEAGGAPALPVDRLSLSAIGWLVVLSSLGGYGFFVASLRRLGVTLTSSLVYLTPAVTLLWAAAMFGEQPSGQGIAGMALAIAGASLAMRSVGTADPRPRAPAARHAPRTW